jgi:hypothetical protein
MSIKPSTLSFVLTSLLLACNDDPDQYIIQVLPAEDGTTVEQEDVQEEEDDNGNGNNSGNDNNNGSNSSGNSDGEGFGEDDNETDSCTYDNFTLAGERAFMLNVDTDQPLFVYQGTNSTENPMDVIEVLSYPGDPYNGPSTPGTYSLAGNNYEDCSLCLLIYAGCTDDGCESLYFADEGSITFDTGVGVDQTFTGWLNDVVFREVEVDPDTYYSTPIAGGKTWCLDSQSLSTMVLER